MRESAISSQMTIGSFGQGISAVQILNSSFEVGLRCAVVLSDAYPRSASMQRLVILDYFVVHTDDLPNGPRGLHPRTPHRGGELLVRRKLVQDGLSLFSRRGLIKDVYSPGGFEYSATEITGMFLDSLQAKYIQELRERATWVNSSYSDFSDDDLAELVRSQLGEWGAEFETESVLWAEE